MSLILNAILVVWVIRLRQLGPIEKVIIEHQQSVKNPVPDANKTQVEIKKNRKKKSAKSVGFPSEREIQDVIDKVQTDRDEFLLGELRLERTQLDKMKRVKEKAYKKMNEAYLHSQGVDSLETRRQVLEIEEKLYQELSQVIGVKNWKKFIKFRNEYNKQHLENNSSGAPIPFMDI